MLNLLSLTFNSVWVKGDPVETPTRVIQFMVVRLVMIQHAIGKLRLILCKRISTQYVAVLVRLSKLELVLNQTKEYSKALKVVTDCFT